MPNSFTTTAHLTCPECGQAFQAAVWLIVDSSERPDLLEEARAGTLHSLACPHCGQVNRVAAPLLLYRPELLDGRLSDTPLIFVGGTDGDAETEQQAAQLLGMLADSLGERWRDGWLRDIPGLPSDFHLPGTAPSPSTQATPPAQPSAPSPGTGRRPEPVEGEGRGGGLSVPPQFAADLAAAQEGQTRYLRGGGLAALDAAADAWNRILKHPTLPTSDQRFRLAAWNDAGGLFLRRYWAARPNCRSQPRIGTVARRGGGNAARLAAASFSPEQFR